MPYNDGKNVNPVLLLLFSQPWAVGGAETHIETLVNQFSKEGKKVIVVGCDEMIVRHFQDLPVYFIAYRSSSLISHLRNVKTLMMIVKKHNVNIVHAHQRTSCIYAWLLHKILRLPFVVTLHDKWRDKHRVYKCFLPKHCIAISEGVKQHFIKIFGLSANTIEVIQNGISLEQYTTADEFDQEQNHIKKTILHISRISRRKGKIAYILCRAMATIVNRFPNVNLVIVGDGEYSSDLADYVQTVNSKISSGSIQFLGPRRDVPILLKQADIVVGAGRVALEAMATGKPVVAIADGTDYPGIITAENWRQASLTSWTRGEKQINEDNLLQDIIFLLGNDEVCKDLGKFGRRLVDKYSSQRMAQRTLNIYYSLLDKFIR